MREFARGAQLEPRHVGQIVARDDGGDAVGVAGDDVAAEFVADLQRALEIELRARRPVLRGGHAQRFGGGIDLEPGLALRTPEPTTVRHTPLQAIEAPSAMVVWS